MWTWLPLFSNKCYIYICKILMLLNFVNEIGFYSTYLSDITFICRVTSIKRCLSHQISFSSLFCCWNNLLKASCLLKAIFPLPFLAILKQIHRDHGVVYRSCRNIEALKLKVSFLGNSEEVAFRTPPSSPGAARFSLWGIHSRRTLNLMQI